MKWLGLLERMIEKRIEWRLLKSHVVGNREREVSPEWYDRIITKGCVIRGHSNWRMQSWSAWTDDNSEILWIISVSIWVYNVWQSPLLMRYSQEVVSVIEATAATGSLRGLQSMIEYYKPLFDGAWWSRNRDNSYLSPRHLNRVFQVVPAHVCLCCVVFVTREATLRNRCIFSVIWERVVEKIFLKLFIKESFC